MKIVDINGDKINACFSFTVGNCEISVSTIFGKDRPEIAIFEGDECVKSGFNTVQAAIYWVNTFGARD